MAELSAASNLNPSPLIPDGELGAISNYNLNVDQEADCVVVPTGEFPKLAIQDHALVCKTIGNLNLG